MAGIFEKMLASDVLLFSFPLYCYGMPAPLKMLMDRTMPLSAMAMRREGERYEHAAQADFSRLRYLMISGCGFPDGSHNFEPMILEFKYMFPNRHTIVTVPESPLFNVPELANVTAPRLALVKKAGEQYAREEKIDAGAACGNRLPHDSGGYLRPNGQRRGLNAAARHLCERSTTI